MKNQRVSFGVGPIATIDFLQKRDTVEEIQIQNVVKRKINFMEKCRISLK